MCGYVYAGAGYGESTTDLVFAGYAGVYENGRLLAENRRFARSESLTVADVDLQRLTFKRARNRSFFTDAPQGQMCIRDRFSAQYTACDVRFEISRYNYMDEKAQLLDKIGTQDATDIFFAGSWNTSAWADKGWLVPLDDIIDEALRSDISSTFWNQNTYEGHVYVLPYHQLQNTLAVNRAMMEQAGLDAFIPEPDTIAHWSTCLLYTSRCV